MRSGEFSKSFCRKVVLCCFFVLLAGGQLIHSASESYAANLTCAKVLEIGGTAVAKIPTGSTKSLEPGIALKTGEEVQLKAGNWIVLVMADSTVRKFEGPATITMTPDLAEKEQGTLTRLGSAIIGLLFSTEEERPEAVMVTRKVKWPEIPQESLLPLLIYPAQGSSVIGSPAKFEWRKIEGVPLYRVSVYSWDRLMWQGTTSDSYIQCPPQQCEFVPGERYYWGVEALIGNAGLRSRSAEFKILAQDTRSELQQTMGDSRLSVASKVRLCMGLGLYPEALELVDSHYGGKSFDRTGYLLRAEVKEQMGLLEDACFDYKKAASLSSPR
jgi:hypothetical protein